MSTAADKTSPSAGDQSVVSPSVEMDNLQSKATSSEPPSQTSQKDPAPSSTVAQPTASTDPSQPSAQTVESVSNAGPSIQPPVDATASQDEVKPAAAAATPLDRVDTEAIGPSSENPILKADTSAGPTVIITLLLTSGARHPYKIDGKYLKKRSVEVEENNPFNISVYTLKELILRDWRDEWEQKSSSPSSIRLIHMGRMLDDKDKLSECRFNEAAPNVVHMTIKPQEIVDDEEAAKTGKSRSGDGEERTPGCRCIIL